MKTILPAVLFAAFATTSAWAAESVQPLEKIAPYPQAEKGMKRQVIQLTPQGREEICHRVSGRCWNAALQQQAADRGVYARQCGCEVPRLEGGREN